MLSVNNQRQTAVPLTAAAQAEAKAGEAAPKGRPLAASTDTVTISGRPEKPTVKRPLSFGCAFDEDEGLTVRLHNQLPVMFDEYASGNIDKESVLRTLDHAISDIVAYWGDKGFDTAEVAQEALRDIYGYSRILMVDTMKSASYVEGKEVAKEMGCTGFTVYYNSDYYYKTEDLIDTVECPHWHSIPLYNSEGNVIGEYKVGCEGHYDTEGLTLEEAREVIMRGPTW